MKMNRRQSIKEWQAYRIVWECWALQAELVECMDAVEWVKDVDGSWLCLDAEKATALVEEYESLVPTCGDSMYLLSRRW
jgi:hypothetical protein